MEQVANTEATERVNVRKQSDFVWEFYNLKEMELDNGITENIHKIFLDGFGLKKGWSQEGIKKSLRRSTILGLLTDPGNCLSGYAMYTIPDEPLLGNYFIWEGAICLKKAAQGRGLSSGVWSMIANFFPNQKFGWVGGRTQNPQIIKRYSQLGSLYPFESTYSYRSGKLVMNYLNHHIVEVRDAKKLDINTGICYSVYREGKLGDYPILMHDSEKYEKQLAGWKFQRERGDAVIVVSRIF